MAENEVYSEIIIVGRGVELYWLALACAKRIQNSIPITIYNLTKESLPVRCEGAWLDELHELIGLSHEDFLQLMRPRLCLGVDVDARYKKLFLAAAPTGVPYRGIPFARLYAAIGAEKLGPFLDYNFAHALNDSNPPHPPANIAQAMCEGLEMEYLIADARYQQLLLAQLQGVNTNIKWHDIVCSLQQEQELIASIANNNELSGNVLLFDLIWQKPVDADVLASEPFSRSGFFASNRLTKIEGLEWGQVMRGQESRFGASVSGCGSGEEPFLWSTTPAGLHYIKLGAGRTLSVLDVTRRILFEQLKGLFLYWPEPNTFDLLSNKFNRTWQAWLREEEDYYQLLLSIVAEDGFELSATNKARIGLYSEIGCLPQVDQVLIKSWEWENLIVSGLGVLPGNRGLPRDIKREDVIKHMAEIKQSFSMRHSK